MSKRDLKKYLSALDKEQIEEQFLALYDKFKDVKVYYDFVFKPNERKLADDAKAKITAEYFPTKTRRAKLRRSTGQKAVKHFLMLGVDPFVIADVMLYAIEVAQRYTDRRAMRYDSFYKGMSTSFAQAVNYIVEQKMWPEFSDRLLGIEQKARAQGWFNHLTISGLYESACEKV